MEDVRIIERLVAVEERSKSNTHRIEEVEDTTKAIHDMNKNIAVMIQKMGNQEEKIDGLKDDVISVKEEVKDIQLAPSKKWDKATWIVVSGVLSFVVGYMINTIIK